MTAQVHSWKLRDLSYNPNRQPFQPRILPQADLSSKEDLICIYSNVKFGITLEFARQAK